MTNIIRPDLLTGSPSFEGNPLPIAQHFIEVVNTSPTDRTEDVLSAALEASIVAIARLELRIAGLMTAVGAVEVSTPTINFADVIEDGPVR